MPAIKPKIVPKNPWKIAKNSSYKVRAWKYEDVFLTFRPNLLFHG